MLCYTLSSNGPAIILSDSALATFDRFRQLSSRAKEAGGQLFARFDGADTLLLNATPPKWLDRRSRNEFVPNRCTQQREIRNQHALGLHFVGDWHTHPEPIPHPSNEDVFSMIDCFGQSVHDLRAFVLIVVGTEPAPDGLYVTIIDGSSGRKIGPERNML